MFLLVAFAAWPRLNEAISIEQQHVMEVNSTISFQEAAQSWQFTVDDLEADVERGSDLGVNLVAKAAFGTSYEGNDEMSSLCDYCAGQTQEDQQLTFGEKVMCNWEGYGPFYPGRITAVYPDGTFKIHYDDGFSEDHVKPKQMRAMSPEEKKEHMKKVGSDPACKFQGLIKEVKPKIEKLEKKMAMWCTNQRATLSKTALPPPPSKNMRASNEAAAIKSSSGDGQIIDDGQVVGDLGTLPDAASRNGKKQLPAGIAPAPAPAQLEVPEDKAQEAEALKKTVEDNNVYIEALKEREKENQLRLEEFALDMGLGGAPAPALLPGMKTVDDLIREYKDRIAAQDDEIARIKRRIEEQEMELARLGANKMPLAKIETECDALEHEVKDAWDEMQEMDLRGELDPDLKHILDGVLSPLKHIRGRLNQLMGLETKTLALREKDKEKAKAAAEAAKRKALEMGLNTQAAADKAKEAARAAEEASLAALRSEEMELLGAAQDLTSSLRSSGLEVKELDFGLHPQGAKWWRYRYEHAYIEAWLMICISILMLIWRKLVQEMKRILEVWALPHGVTLKHELGWTLALGEHPGRDDGSMYLVWFSCLAEMMLTCILVFVTIWIICKTTLVDLLPFAITAGDMHVPFTGDQYRRLAIDCATIYFFAILMYFLMIFPIAHHAKKIVHRLQKEFKYDTPRSGAIQQFGEKQSIVVNCLMGSLAASQTEYTSEKEMFANVMSRDIGARVEPEAAKLKEMFGSNWQSFPLSRYLIINVQLNIATIFEFLWKLWLPFVICFICFSGMHRFWHMGYVRIMMFFTLCTFLLIFAIGWYTRNVRKVLDDEAKDVQQTQAHSIHTKWHTETIVLKSLQFALFFQCYGLARMIGQPWMWELHFWPVLYLTLLAIALAVIFIVLVAPALPSFCAVMALPPYVNPQNMRIMLYAAECDRNSK